MITRLTEDPGYEFRFGGVFEKVFPRNFRSSEFGFHQGVGEAAEVRAYDESMEMFTAAQSDPNMGELHLDRLRVCFGAGIRRVVATTDGHLDQMGLKIQRC